MLRGGLPPPPRPVRGHAWLGPGTPQRLSSRPAPPALPRRHSRPGPRPGLPTPLTWRRRRSLARATSAALGTERKAPVRGAGIIRYPEASGTCAQRPLRAPPSDVRRCVAQENAGDAIIPSCPAATTAKAKGSSGPPSCIQWGECPSRSLGEAGQSKTRVRSAAFFPLGLPGCHAAPTAPTMQRSLHAQDASLRERLTRPANYESHGAWLPEARLRCCLRGPHVARALLHWSSPLPFRVSGGSQTREQEFAVRPAQWGGRAAPRAHTAEPSRCFPPAPWWELRPKLGGPVTAAPRSGARSAEARVTPPPPPALALSARDRSQGPHGRSTRSTRHSFTLRVRNPAAGWRQS